MRLTKWSLLGALVIAGACVEENPFFVELDDGGSTGAMATTGEPPADVTTDRPDPATGSADGEDTTAAVVDGTSTGDGGESSSDTSGGRDCSEEVCDGVDNDCDDEIDEGCDCRDGETEPCYGGPAGTEGVGVCVGGQRECTGGTWGPCVGEVLPSDEACNGLDEDCDGSIDEDFGQTMCGDGICMVVVDVCVDGELVTCEPGRPEEETCDGYDEDCDGEVDEDLDCACIIGETQPCYTGPRGTAGVGECMMGTQPCLDGQQFGACTGDVTPQPESCDAADNDCDGEIDEGNPGGGGQCVFNAPGACAQGSFQCQNGTFVCTQVVFPSNEVCDAVDNDCDFGIDEGNPGGGQPCTTSAPGLCANGQTLCQAGSITCSQTVLPALEVCDGLDNDCDGVVDEGNPGGGQACSTGMLGNCNNGTTACSGGELSCTQTVFPSNEVCDAADNDCDGEIDEGVTGGGLPCNTGQQGVCSQGLSDCTGGMSVCVQQNQPSVEVCDGLDNDCNGAVDNGNPGGGAACMTGLPGTCANGTTQCTNGSIACTPNSSGSPEICDGLDNDCDGPIDEGNPGGGAACMTTQPGVCAAGTTVCTGGSLQCQSNTSPSNEICNGLDDDCDGTADENNPGGLANCTTGLPGVCSAGTTSCQGGSLVCNQTTMASSEVCDGLDNDCDGVADESNPGGGAACTTTQPGVCSAGTTQCSGGSIVCQSTTPPSTEVCDGLDNNCNGSTDEGNPGGGLACTTTQPGICSTGTTQCSSGAIVCNANNSPGTEICNGLDDDCDGLTDENNPGGGMSCATGQAGICAQGTTTCSGGAIACTPNNSPQMETCDGLDNDCDGLTDEGNPGGGGACNTGQLGVCASGTTTCSGGALVCQPNTTSSAEVCDGLDNDCDGAVDEGNPGGGTACNTGQPGVCGPGTTVCSGGAFTCMANQGPSSEICDGLDNDCDGTADEGNPGGGMQCNTGLLGQCGIGSTTCSGGSIACQQQNFPSPETCDGLDNNCNGAVDEGNPGGGGACDTGLQGVCATGTLQCSGGSVSCFQTTFPVAEVCGNGLDDDCNGSVDNGCPCPNVIADGGFEAGAFAGFWTESSTQFGTPLCTVASCGTGGGSGPQQGAWWAWFGGFDGNELAIVSQSVTIPVGSATLSFYLQIPVCANAGADTLQVSVDGVPLFTRTNTSPECGVISYAQHSIDISAFADGGQHIVEFRGQVFGQGPPATSITNFFVDTVALIACPP